MKDLTKKLLCLTAGLIITHTTTAIENPAGLPPELAPEITIIDNGHRLVEEYRANGRIFMIKINPKKGPAFILSMPMAMVTLIPRKAIYHPTC